MESNRWGNWLTVEPAIKYGHTGARIRLDQHKEVECEESEELDKGDLGNHRCSSGWRQVIGREESASESFFLA